MEGAAVCRIMHHSQTKERTEANEKKITHRICIATSPVSRCGLESYPKGSNSVTLTRVPCGMPNTPSASASPVRFIIAVIKFAGS